MVKYLGKQERRMIGKVTELFKRHPEQFATVGLFLICYIFFFHQLGDYPLLDVDETRYASMAREILDKSGWLTISLNYEPFFEKPPLYFWLLALSYMLFGKVSEFAARFPIALIATFITLYTYHLGKTIISRVFGLISALILVSSIQFLMLSHIAILDLILSAFIASTIYSGLLAFFAEDKYKKYYWWSAYFFSALAVLAKGLPGVVISFAVLGVAAIQANKLKEMLKPINILPGMLIFFATILPWHVLMYQEHGMAFINEYFIKHHFARFINSENLGRKEPVYFFIPVFIVGFFPWIFSFIAYLISSIKDIFNNLKRNNTFKNIKEIISPCAKIELFLCLITSYFLFTFMFFSAASTKLPTYILPLFPAVSMLTGYYWYKYIAEGKNKAGIKASVYLQTILCFIAVAVGLFIVPKFVHKILIDISVLKDQVCTWFIVVPLFSLIFLHLNKRIHLFATQVVFMAGVLFITLNQVLPIVYHGGQKELVDYAHYVRNVKNSQLITFNYGVRPSTLWAYSNKVHWVVAPDLDKLESLLKSSKSSFVILKNKTIKDISKNINYKVIKKGVKYSLVASVSVVKKQ